jgi:hypothetical protein
VRYIEQVFDESDQLLHLPVDNRVGPPAHGRVGLGRTQEGDGIAQGGERVAELVREGGQEGVFPAVRFAQRFFGTTPIAHVDDRRHVSDHAAMFIQLRLVREPHELTSEPLVRHFDLDVDAFACERAYEVGLDGVVGLLAQDLGDPPADQIRGLQSEPRRVRPVDELEPLLEIAVRDQHRGAVGDESQLPLRPPRGFLGCEPQRDVAVDFEHDLLTARRIQGPA